MLPDNWGRFKNMMVIGGATGMAAMTMAIPLLKRSMATNGYTIFAIVL